MQKKALKIISLLLAAFFIVMSFILIPAGVLRNKGEDLYYEALTGNNTQKYLKAAEALEKSIKIWKYDAGAVKLLIRINDILYGKMNGKNLILYEMLHAQHPENPYFEKAYEDLLTVRKMKKEME